MSDNPYQRYMKMKALADFYESLSDEEKRILFQPQYENENIIQKLDVIEKKVDKNKYSFAFDVLANVTGNTINDTAVWLLKKIFPKI